VAQFILQIRKVAPCDLIMIRVGALRAHILNHECSQNVRALFPHIQMRIYLSFTPIGESLSLTRGCVCAGYTGVLCCPRTRGRMSWKPSDGHRAAMTKRTMTNEHTCGSTIRVTAAAHQIVPNTRPAHDICNSLGKICEGHNLFHCLRRRDRFTGVFGSCLNFRQVMKRYTPPLSLGHVVLRLPLQLF